MCMALGNGSTCEPGSQRKKVVHQVWDCSIPALPYMNKAAVLIINSFLDHVQLNSFSSCK